MERVHFIGGRSHATIGLAEMLPNEDNNQVLLTNNADKMLYLAKEKGRNRLEC